MRGVGRFGRGEAAFATWEDIDVDAFKPGADKYDVRGWIPTQSDTGQAWKFITDELEELRALMADDRDRYMPEILAQADAAPLYWLQLLNLGAAEKPWTQALIAFAQRAGEMVALHFKYKYHRVRPSTLLPGLLVPFGPPRHPAFPSGHSLTGHLTAGLLNKIPKVKERLEKDLDWLAKRVAKNRERAGLHYKSDSEAGAKLAVAFKDLMVAGTITSPRFNEILTNAEKEWKEIQ